MEKKYSKNSKAKSFFKRNMYYIIMAVCVLAIGAMITVAVLAQQNNSKPTDLNTDPTTPGITDPTDPTDPGITDPTDPTPEPIVFASPVMNGNVIKDYAMDKLVFWSTLKSYKVHDGIDFSGNEGAEVTAAYDGTVVSVTYDKLYGNVVKIDHGEGLVTSYGSLTEPVVSEGQVVTKGTKLATIGSSAGNELLQAPHVHFSVFLNNKIVNPYEYLPTGDK